MNTETGAVLCTDANGGATTSGCPAAVTGYKLECVNVTPVTVGNTVTTTNLQACTIPANDIGAAQTFYIDAVGIIGDTAAPSFTITVTLDGTVIGSLTPTLAAANTQPWGARIYFTGITTGTTGTLSGAIMWWSSSPSGGGFIANTTGVGALPQTVTINTTVSHTLALTVTRGAANASNTITENTLTVHRIG